jgi:copper chaperone
MPRVGPGNVPDREVNGPSYIALAALGRQENASVAEEALSGQAARSTNVVLRIAGMHCASCSALINETLADTPGVLTVSVELEPGRATVAFDPDVVTVESLVALIAEAGYGAALGE